MFVPASGARDRVYSAKIFSDLVHLGQNLLKKFREVGIGKTNCFFLIKILYFGNGLNTYFFRDASISSERRWAADLTSPDGDCPMVRLIS